jgi:hypothetical protein
MRVPCPAASKTAVTFINSPDFLPRSRQAKKKTAFPILKDFVAIMLIICYNKKADLRSTGRRKACLSLEKKPRRSGKR